MYIPPAFAETDRDKLLEFIAAHSFGLLISQLGGQPFASHLPLLVKSDALPNGRLVGHMARANPHWREMSGQQVLAVFSGPHAYISPRWYESDNVVPTWNYLSVHVLGTCHVIDDEQATAKIVEDYVATYEHSLPSETRWTIDPATPLFQRLVKLVVGFHIDIDRIEGKWKLGQNHPAQWRANVVSHLEQSQDANDLAIARLMAQTLE